MTSTFAFECGDVNCSGGQPDIADITRLIDFLYLSHAPLCDQLIADVNGSGGMPDISDITAIIVFLYLSHEPLNCITNVAIGCPGDDEKFLCEPDIFCYEYTVEPSSALVSVDEPAYINDIFVCVPVEESGTQHITITAQIQNVIDSCSFEVTANINQTPTIQLGEDSEFTNCELSEICIPFEIFDADFNLDTVFTNLGTIQLQSSQVCFTPPSFGTHQIIVTATDLCGRMDIDTCLVTITEGFYASVECPGTQYASINGPDTVCVPVSVTAAEAVTVLPAGYYDSESGIVCIFVNAGGTVPVTVIAEGLCGSDTCMFDLEVEFNDQVTDIDGNVYQTVTIGSQVWMAENLRVTHYRNGDPIPNVTNGTTWAGLTTGAYCNYENDSANVETYGRLYNWYAVDDSRGLAPVGWHVPTDEEWKQLEMFLGMSQAEADADGFRGTDEGGKLKETGTVHWLIPNTGATNESGFTALPGGDCNSSGNFSSIGERAHFWSVTEYNSGSSWPRYLRYFTSDINRFPYSKRSGFSVRCVKD